MRVVLDGVIASCHTQGRPNLCKLLARYCEANRPGFKFTSIQVNKNYESALHCDKKNLGPSASKHAKHRPPHLDILG